MEWLDLNGMEPLMFKLYSCHLLELLHRWFESKHVRVPTGTSAIFSDVYCDHLDIQVSHEVLPYFLGTGGMANWETFTKKVGSDFESTTTEEPRINYLSTWPHGQLRSYLSSGHSLTATAWSQSHQKLFKTYLHQHYRTCLTSPCNMPHAGCNLTSCHCGILSWRFFWKISELLKIRSLSLQNWTSNQENKSNHEGFSSKLPVGNISDQYKGTRGEEKNLQPALTNVPLPDFPGTPGCHGLHALTTPGAVRVLIFCDGLPSTLGHNLFQDTMTSW